MNGTIDTRPQAPRRSVKVGLSRWALTLLAVGPLAGCAINPAHKQIRAPVSNTNSMGKLRVNVDDSVLVLKGSLVDGEQRLAKAGIDPREVKWAIAESLEKSYGTSDDAPQARFVISIRVYTFRFAGPLFFAAPFFMLGVPDGQAGARVEAFGLRYDDGRAFLAEIPDGTRPKTRATWIYAPAHAGLNAALVEAVREALQAPLERN